MIAQQRFEMTLAFQIQEPLDHAGRIRAAVDVVPQCNHEIMRLGIQAFQKRIQGFQAAVNIPDGKNSGLVVALFGRTCV